MRRIIIAGLVVIFWVSGVGGENEIKAADRYPAKPITYIIPMEVGADADIVSRPQMQKASAILGKPIVIVNKPGGGQTIGMREIYGAKPDGYTIGFGNVSIILSKMVGLFPYDYHDFTSLCLLHTSSAVIVASTKTKRPFETFPEVVSFAKAHPGEVTMLTSATGGPLWLTGVLLQENTKLQFNMIPQEGSAGFIVSQLAGGHADIGITFFPSAKAQIEAGNARCIAVAGNERIPGKYNYIPTLKEMGYDVSVYSFGSIIGPPKIPKEIVEKLVKTFETVMKDPEVENFCVARNFIPKFLPREAFMDFCNTQRAISRPVLERAGLLKEK
jgi:tripartite-type tricarboxylate transporter receptor subunit TctC